MPRRMPWLLVLGAVALLSAPLPARAAQPQSGRVSVFLTTHDLRATLARQPDVAFSAATGAEGQDVAVDPHATGQTLTAGFGVAMTDTSAYLLSSRLPARRRDRALDELFSPARGIGLTFLRLPIAGSDYVVGRPYSYDDQPPGAADPSLAGFSIDHDRAYVLPMIRAALARNPHMTVMANPWTPPAWMKTDDQLVTTTAAAGQLEPQYYGAYADYLVRFLQAYRAAGVDVRYLGVQNEPLTPLLLVAGIPESYLGPAEEGALIGQYVAPALRRAGLGAGIVAYDDGFERSEGYIPVVMGLAGADVSGFAYHCYFSDPKSIEVESRAFPGKAQLETECSSKLSTIEPQQMAIRSLRSGAQGIQLWNAAIDQHGGPKIGNGCKGIVGPFAGQDCIAPLTVDTDTRSYTRTSDFWALAHFSRFIRPGARRIGSTSPASCPTSPAQGRDCGLEDVAFQNADGSRVLVATANDGSAHTFSVTEGARRFRYTLPDGATATFVWDDPPPVVSGVVLARRVRRGRAATLRYRLSKDATVTVTIARRAAGGRYRAVRVVRQVSARGAGALRLPRVDARRRPLGAGAYRLTVSAVDHAGTRSRPLRRALRIAARKGVAGTSAAYRHVSDRLGVANKP